MSEDGYDGPMTPERREFLQKIREHQEKQKQEQQDALDREKEIKRRDAEALQIRLAAHTADPDTIKNAAEILARDLAKAGAQPGRIDWNETKYRNLADEAVAKAQETYVAEAKRGAEAAAALRAMDRLKEQRAREEKTQTAQREPVKGVVERFNNVLAEKQAEREGRAHPNFVTTKYQEQKKAEEPGQTVTSSLLDKDRAAVRGEISDARAERFARMYNKPATDKDFDPSHDPSNERNFSHTRGGRQR